MPQNALVHHQGALVNVRRAGRRWASRRFSSRCMARKFLSTLKVSEYDVTICTNDRPETTIHDDARSV